ncbi:MAG: DUF1428 domain-containing protein [Phycisphaeraceae bacterium]
MNYIDGFVMPILKKNVPAYRKLAKLACAVWMDHGALEYREAVGEDLDTPCGLPFPRLTKMKKGETVVFAWIAYKSRAHRDRVNKKVMADPRLTKLMGKPMPFDMKRMSHGGFKIIVKS